MPDDHSKSVPPLPIPNRTVKRFCADDSAATSVKVGYRQASYLEKPPSGDPEIRTAIRALDAAVGEMLQLQGDLPVILHDVADADVVAELERGRQFLAIIFIQAGQQVNADARFVVNPLLAVVLEAEHRSEAHVPQAFLLAWDVAVLVLAPVTGTRFPVSAQVGAVRLEPLLVPILGGAQADHALFRCGPCTVVVTRSGAELSMRITFLGIGLMGEPMARRLLAAGQDLTVWNRTAAKAEALAEAGARPVVQLADAVRDAGIVISMLEAGPVVAQVLHDALPALTPGTLWVDMSSTRQAEAQAFDALLQANGCRFVDAPVSGGVGGAAAGTLAIMAGGSVDDFEQLMPVLAALGRATLVGPAGSGQVAKLCNQMIVGATIHIVAEALLLAQAAGADPAAMRAALRGDDPAERPAQHPGCGGCRRRGAAGDGAGDGTIRNAGRDDAAGGSFRRAGRAGRAESRRAGGARPEPDLTCQRQALLHHLDPETGADRQQVVVEVVAAVVQHARTQAVAAIAVIAFAVADEHIAAGLGLQEVRKIFRAHGGLHVVVHLVGAQHLFHHFHGKAGFGRMVDQRRVVAAEAEFHLGAKRGRRVLRNLSHALLDHVQHRHRKGAHRAHHPGFVGDHIGGAARVDLGNRQHGRIERTFLPADDGLPALRDLHRHHHRVDALVRLRRMAALALDGEVELVTGRHHRARHHTHVAGGNAGPVMHAVDGVHRALLEQAVFDHAPGAGTAFFGRLENQVHRAIEVAMLSQVFCCAEQHGRMAVMAARVHLAGMARRVLERVHFLHGQGIHVGAQADGARGRAVLDDADDAGHAQAADDGDAPRRQFFGDHVGRALFFVAKFWMGVQVAADLLYFGLKRNDGLN
uniref:Probable 3-hydroxyisobutyrate dehydrogenase-like 2, mitochondrial n=1 Tax=Tanacetum cinerariifolium TaxID=118510 RepID=A0A699GLP6_TANCI|nr:probable 3-hydroxyisobutyrate dehydrogenase-like 2, mitochondrial [Tanacetum cinerariifolium]